MESIQLNEQEKSLLTMLTENFFDTEKTFSEMKNQIKEKVEFKNISPDRAEKLAENEATLQTRELFKSLGIKLNSIGKNLKKKS